MDNYNKILLLFQKLDDGSISDLEINELNNIIDTSNFDSSVINPNLDSQLNNINTDISGLNDVNTNEYLDDYLNKFNDNISNIKPSIVNNPGNITNNLTNTVANTVTNGIIASSKFTSIIASISFMSIIGISYFTYNYFTNQDKTDVKNEYVINKSTEAIKDNSNEILDNQASNSINSQELNSSVTDFINSNINSNNKSDKSNKSISESIESENIKSKIKQLRTDKDMAVYNDEILSVFVQNNDELNKILQNYTNKLKIAQKNDDVNNQVEILYKLAVIYRVKNISNEKSIEILNRAISVIENSKVNENEFNLIKSDLYGELYKSYKSIGNFAESNSALKKCVNYLNNQTSNSENKMIVIKKVKYWNDILNSQQ